jgi:aspartate aminotransferase/aminotransferase
MSSVEGWIAERMARIEPSGIRKVFELARTLVDPVNLSIGQPDFDVPEPIKTAAHNAIDRGANAYTLTQGIVQLRDRLSVAIEARFPQQRREVVVTSGTSGALTLALCCVVNPGDEVIILDPYFLIYPHLVTLAGGTSVFVDTYPDFDLPVDKIVAALTPRTKAILLNSPNNPTGKVYSREKVRQLAQLAAERKILLISDEIYSLFTYENEFPSPAEYNEDVLVIDGFSKTYAMTGWRLGYAHGPQRLIQEMAKLQQFTFVCAPSMVQHAGITALDYDTSAIRTAYQAKRDKVVAALRDRYELVYGGAFYLFVKAPGGNSHEFVTTAIRNNLLLVPGNVFSRQDTHFRLSYAADDRTLERGIEILNRLVSSQPGQ